MATLDADARGVLDLIASYGRPSIDTLPLADARKAARIGCLMLQGEQDAVAGIEDFAAPGPNGPIAVRVYRPAGSGAGEVLPALAFLHGGGFVVMDLECYDKPARRLANLSRCAVLLIDYRSAPECRFPGPLEDCAAALRWIAGNAARLHIDPTRLAVAGDSAGGNLAAAVALVLRGSAVRLAHQFLIYPVIDLRGDWPSTHEFAEGYFLTRALMRWFIGQYVRNENDKLDWRGSPLLADSHAALPPAYVLTAGFDPLRDEGRAYAEKLRAAGVPVTLREYEAQIHGFMTMDKPIREARAALAELAQAVKTALGA